MALYLVEHRLPRVTQRELLLLQEALAAACARLTARRQPVRYLGSTFLPTSNRLLSLFEAAGADLVRKAAESSQAPVDALEIAIDMPNHKEA